MVANEQDLLPMMEGVDEDPEVSHLSLSSESLDNHPERQPAGPAPTSTPTTRRKAPLPTGKPSPDVRPEKGVLQGGVASQKAKLQSYKQSLIAIASPPPKPAAQPVMATNLPPDPLSPMDTKVDLQGRLAGFLVQVPPRGDNRAPFLAESPDGRIYQLDRAAFSTADRALLDKRQGYLPVTFIYAKHGGTVRSVHRPPRSLPLSFGKDARVVTDPDLAAGLTRVHFHILERSDVLHTDKPSSRSLIPHSLFGPALAPIMVLDKDLPKDIKESPGRWFTAFPLCSAASGSSLGGFIRLLNHRPSKSYEIETLPFGLRAIYDAPCIIEPSFLKTLSRNTGPLDLIIGTPASPSIMEVPAHVPGPRERLHSLQGVLTSLLTEYQKARSVDGLADAEVQFLRQLSSKVQALLTSRKALSFLLYQPTLSFESHLECISFLLTGVKATTVVPSPPKHVGYLLFEIDHCYPDPRDAMVHNPALYDLLLNSGLGFKIYSPSAAVRLMCAKGCVLVNNSSLGKVFLVAQVTKQPLDTFLPGLGSSLTPGQRLVLQELDTLDLKSALLEDSDVDIGDRSDDLETQHPECTDLRITSLLYHLDDTVPSSREVTEAGVTYLTRKYRKFLSQDTTFTDKTLKLKLKVVTLAKSPPPAELHDFLGQVPNAWLSSSVLPFNHTLILKFRGSQALLFEAVTDGLRGLDKVTTIFPSGTGTITVCPLTDMVVNQLITSLIESSAVDYYIWRGVLIPGCAAFAAELGTTLWPAPPAFLEAPRVLVMGAAVTCPVTLLVRALKEIPNVDISRARWAQDGNAQVAILLPSTSGPAPYEVPHGFVFSTPGAHRFKLTTHRLEAYTNLGAFVVELTDAVGPDCASPLAEVAAPPVTVLSDCLKRTRLTSQPRLSGDTKLTDFFKLVASSKPPRPGPCSYLGPPCCDVPDCPPCPRCSAPYCPQHAVRCPHVCAVETCTGAAVAGCLSCDTSLCVTHLVSLCPHPPVFCGVKDCLQLSTSACSACTLPVCGLHSTDHGCCPLVSVPSNTTEVMSDDPNSPTQFSCVVVGCRRSLDSALQEYPDCGCLTCLTHAELPHPHLVCSPSPTLCGFQQCVEPSTGACSTSACSRLLCTTHLHSTCPHALTLQACRYDSCPNRGATICSANPSCGSLLCHDHDSDKTTFPCPHQSCSLCPAPSPGTHCMGCDKDLCALHSASKCPHKLSGLLKCNDCTERCAGLCPMGCETKLCLTHLTSSTCPHAAPVKRRRKAPGEVRAKGGSKPGPYARSADLSVSHSRLSPESTPAAPPGHVPQ